MVSQSVKLLVCWNLFLGDIGDIFTVKYPCSFKCVSEQEVLTYGHKFMFVGLWVEKSIQARVREATPDENNNLLLEQQSHCLSRARPTGQPAVGLNSFVFYLVETIVTVIYFRLSLSQLAGCWHDAAQTPSQ